MIIDLQLGDDERSFKRARAVLQEKYVYKYYVYKYIYLINILYIVFLTLSLSLYYFLSLSRIRLESEKYVKEILCPNVRRNNDKKTRKRRNG